MRRLAFLARSVQVGAKCRRSYNSGRARRAAMCTPPCAFSIFVHADFAHVFQPRCSDSSSAGA